MADRVPAMTAITSSPTNAIKTVVAPSNLRLSSNSTKVTSLRKTGPHIIIALADCEVFLNKRPLKNIWIHLQSLIKNSNHTKAIGIQTISRDNHQNYRYFIFVSIHVEENLLWIHTDKWLSKTLPKVRVLAIIFYPIMVNSVSVSKILNPITRQIMAEAISKISEDNDNLLVDKIGWLS